MEVTAVDGLRVLAVTLGEIYGRSDMQPSRSSCDIAPGHDLSKPRVSRRPCEGLCPARQADPLHNMLLTGPYISIPQDLWQMIPIRV